MFRKERWYYSIAKLYPPSWRKSIEQDLIWGGYEYPYELWVGPTIVLSLLVLVMLPLMQWVVFGYLNWIGLSAAVGGFVIVNLLAYLTIYFRGEDRANRVEKVLPDAFQLMASNIRAGMTPFAAIRMAAKPEFGPLEDELNKATSKALGQAPLEDALISISNNIKSEVFERSIKLFVASIKAGGKLADLLEQSAKDIRAREALKNEMVTNTKTYTMFIMFTIIIGAPVLFSISIHFVEMMESMTAGISGGDLIAQTGFSAGIATGITVKFLTRVSIFSLMATSVLASMMMGVITEGKEKYGVKFLPIMATGSLVVFFIARSLIGSFFGGMI